MSSQQGSSSHILEETTNVIVSLNLTLIDYSSNFDFLLHTLYAQIQEN